MADPKTMQTTAPTELAETDLDVSGGLNVELENTLVSSYSVSGDGGDGVVNAADYTIWRNKRSG